MNINAWERLWYTMLAVIWKLRNTPLESDICTFRMAAVLPTTCTDAYRSKKPFYFLAHHAVRAIWRTEAGALHGTAATAAFFIPEVKIALVLKDKVTGRITPMVGLTWQRGESMFCSLCDLCDQLLATCSKQSQEQQHLGQCCGNRFYSSASVKALNKDDVRLTGAMQWLKVEALVLFSPEECFSWVDLSLKTGLVCLWHTPHNVISEVVTWIRREQGVETQARSAIETRNNRSTTQHMDMQNCRW